MKINITHQPIEYLDYINSIGIDDKSILEHVENNEATEIRAVDFMDQLSPPSFSLFIDKCVSKLRHGGKLVLGGNEAFSLARLLFRGDIDIEAFNQKMYGNNNKMCLNIETVNGLLTSKGLNIISSRLVDGHYMIVEAVRP